MHRPDRDDFEAQSFADGCSQPVGGRFQADFLRAVPPVAAEVHVLRIKAGTSPFEYYAARTLMLLPLRRHFRPTDVASAQCNLTSAARFRGSLLRFFQTAMQHTQQPRQRSGGTQTSLINVSFHCHMLLSMMWDGTRGFLLSAYALLSRISYPAECHTRILPARLCSSAEAADKAGHSVCCSARFLRDAGPAGRHTPGPPASRGHPQDRCSGAD